jgi:hypothetical protein
MTNDNEDKDWYEEEYPEYPPTRYPWREIITFILAMSILIAGLWWIIWKVYDWI